MYSNPRRVIFSLSIFIQIHFFSQENTIARCHLGSISTVVFSMYSGVFYVSKGSALYELFNFSTLPFEALPGVATETQGPFPQERRVDTLWPISPEKTLDTSCIFCELSTLLVLVYLGVLQDWPEVSFWLQTSDSDLEFHDNSYFVWNKVYEAYAISAMLN